MPYTLRLRISDDVYKALVRRAEEVGLPPEALAADWLASTAHAASSEDPLESFIGAFEGSGSDIAHEHDRYLGATLADEMTGEGRSDA